MKAIASNFRDSQLAVRRWLVFISVALWCLAQLQFPTIYFCNGNVVGDDDFFVPALTIMGSISIFSGYFWMAGAAQIPWLISLQRTWEGRSPIPSSVWIAVLWASGFIGGPLFPKICGFGPGWWIMAAAFAVPAVGVAIERKILNKN